MAGKANFISLSLPKLINNRFIDMLQWTKNVLIKKNIRPETHVFVTNKISAICRKSFFYQKRDPNLVEENIKNIRQCFHA